MHGSPFRINDVRFSWENPFIFYDFDKDNLSEMAIRLVDTPDFRPKDNSASKFDKMNPEHDIDFTKRIDYAAITWDLDNDNGQGNEFDFDMSLKFSGKGFDYSDQKHTFKNMRGLPEADKYFYDPRWRQNDELIYPDEKVSYNKIFNEGKWNYCWFVFDEDDDCNRWERVEFYEPRSYGKLVVKKVVLTKTSKPTRQVTGESSTSIIQVMAVCIFQPSMVGCICMVPNGVRGVWI